MSGPNGLDRWGTAPLLPAALLVAFGSYVLMVLEAPDTATWSVLRDLVAGNLTGVLCIATLLRRARLHPAERASCRFLAAGTGSFLLSAWLFLAHQLLTGRSELPPAAYWVSLLTQPFLLVGVLLALGPHLRRARFIVALDGLACAMAGAAVAAAVAAPVAGRSWGDSGTGLASLAFVVGDVMLVTASLGALAVVGLDCGRHFLLWALGTLTFSVGDLAFLHLRVQDAYSAVSVVNCFWAGGLVLMALGATAVRHRDPDYVPPVRSLTVSSVACIASVAVLTFRVEPEWSSRSVPSLLALLALTAVGARFTLAFRQLQELAVVRQQALTDDLTGAGNRRALDQRLAELLPGEGDAGAPAPAPFALALIDLDHFKEVNDSHGHSAGDALLRAVVQRFERALDELRTPYLLARLGGDEFALVLPEVDGEAAAAICGEALQESLREPVALDEVVLHVQASIGLAVAPRHARTPSDLLFAADSAMYDAKTSGERVCLFSPTATGDRRQRLQIAEDLYGALERHELTVEYQPLMTPHGGLVGAEALVRWDHPLRGRLSPDEFLDVAERYRLMPSIAERVLDVALGDLRQWRVAAPLLTVAVNVSASDLRDEALVDTVASALLRHNVPPSALVIEVTETAMMRDPEMAHTVMRELNDLGVNLAVDDYGTGYSSLEYLLRLPISAIKLDRAFSADLATRDRSAAIVRSTVDLTHALGLHMVAEGVEDEATLEVLRDLGCDLVQGWHLGRPVPAADFGRLVARAPLARVDAKSQLT